MTSAFNPFIVAKMLDLAGHPATSDREALVALRKANDHCSSRGKTIGDVVRFVDGPLYMEAAKMPKADLLKEIAELRGARDDAEARARAQAEAAADLRRAQTKNALTIDGLRAEIAVLGEKLASQATPVVSVNPVPAMFDEAVSVDCSTTEMPPTAVFGIDDRVEHARAHEPIRVEPVLAAQCDDNSLFEPNPAAFSEFERARLILLASLGHAGSSIARSLSREFGRRVSAASVAEVLRQRWLSPRFRGLVDAAASARRKIASRSRTTPSRGFVPMARRAA